MTPFRHHRARPTGRRRSSAALGTLVLVLALIACDQATAPTPLPDVEVTLAPTSANLAQGQSVSFTDTVVGTADTGVTWAATCGTIAGTGTTITYTAPDTTTSCTLTATSTADPSKSATATIDVAGIGIVIAPTGASLLALQTQSFTATVEGTADTSVTWTTTCGTVTGTGTGTTIT